jgi:hypothetical protein
MPCAYCGSNLGCAYVVEWLGMSPSVPEEDGIDPIDAYCLLSDTPRLPGTLCVAIPFSPCRVALVDIPMVHGMSFRVDPVLWNATLFAMVTRRRERTPCLAYEQGSTFEWLSKGLSQALSQFETIAPESQPPPSALMWSSAPTTTTLFADAADDDQGAEAAQSLFTAGHANYARRRIALQYQRRVEERERQLAMEEALVLSEMRRVQRVSREVTTCCGRKSDAPRASSHPAAASHIIF